MRIFAIRLLAFLVIVAVVPAAAQDCTLNTITGTYVFRYTGESFLGGMPQPPTAEPGSGTLPVHSAGLYASGVIVGVFTIHADASVDFKYWSTIGSWSSMRTGVTATGRILDIAPDRTDEGVVLGCVGTVEYQPFGTSLVHKDKFFVLENGREIRSLPVETPAFPTVASLGVAHRIHRSGDAAPRCAANASRGSNLLTCPGPLFNPTGEFQTVGSAAVIDLRILENGMMTGFLHNRSASQVTSTPLNGFRQLNTDCTGEGWFSAPQFAPGAIIRYMFVLYDEGKRGFALPLELYYENTKTTVAYPPISCDMTRAIE